MSDHIVSYWTQFRRDKKTYEEVFCYSRTRKAGNTFRDAIFQEKGDCFVKTLLKFFRLKAI